MPASKSANAVRRGACHASVYTDGSVASFRRIRKSRVGGPANRIANGVADNARYQFGWHTLVLAISVE